MIISPPYLPRQNDPAADVMDTIMDRELLHGIYPICADRRWPGGSHIAPPNANEPVRAIADGEVIAYRVCQGLVGPDGGPNDSNAGFVLLRHETETGEGRKLRFYSLYMHLRHLGAYAATGCNANLLPQWLRTPADAVSGGGKKVHRKDILGWTGECQGQQFLHFEIFMEPKDFDDYFKTTQLGNDNPTTPASTDYWGNGYFVIPAGLPILALPPGTNAQNELNGITFLPLQSGQTSKKLYVETRFHRGSKLTRVWCEEGDSQQTSLTVGPPITEDDYEYDMYQRATALYPKCPSDGYEMLRFGRILSTPVTLPEEARATWFRLRFDTDKEGYIDISHPSIQKLSDADFPRFRGWQKMSEGNGPFQGDGLCDIELLQKMLKDNNMIHNPHENVSANQELQYYMQMAPDVRKKLRGIVCEMPSEWDQTNNEARYKKLKDPGEFYADDEAGYVKFMQLLAKFQFWDKTGINETLATKIWFFHPLEFIRHFRCCGWLSESEMLQLIPERIIRKPGSHNSPSQRFWESPNINLAKDLLKKHRVELNNSLRKYTILTPIRQACFFGNSTQETGWFRDLRESGGQSPNLHLGWYGRGFLQLTNKDGNINGGNNNYYKYFKFIGRVPNTPPGQQEVLWRDMVGTNSYHASQSAGVYWVWDNKSVKTLQNPNRPQVDSASKYADVYATNQRMVSPTDQGNRVWYYNQSFVDCAAAVNYPGSTGQTPPNMNGLIDRSTAYVNALVVLCDTNKFIGVDGVEREMPENFSRRIIS